MGVYSYSTADRGRELISTAECGGVGRCQHYVQVGFTAACDSSSMGIPSRAGVVSGSDSARSGLVGWTLVSSATSGYKCLKQLTSGCTQFPCLVLMASSLPTYLKRAHDFRAITITSVAFGCSPRMDYTVCCLMWHTPRQHCCAPAFNSSTAANIGLQSSAFNAWQAIAPLALSWHVHGHVGAPCLSPDSLSVQDPSVRVFTMVSPGILSTSSRLETGSRQHVTLHYSSSTSL